MHRQLIIGIETSCDETAAGIVDADGRLFANVVATQAAVHAKFGGIVPEVASRQHIRAIPAVVETALEHADLDWRGIDAIAVTNGPGLAGSLMVGVNFAKGVAAASGKPLIAVNHLVGHVMAAFVRLPARPDDDDKNVICDSHAPVAEAIADIGDSNLMCLIVSGGHTELVLAKRQGPTLDFTLVGETRDDAAGEAFDKAARAIGLPYPGGPAIQNAAEGASRSNVEPLPRAWLRGSMEFSFSGLKTAVINRARREGIYPRSETDPPPDPQIVSDISKAFQDSVIDVLVVKTIEAARKYGCSAIVLVGGVAANRPLREAMTQAAPLPVVTPPIPLCTDNGAMIARAGLDLYMDDRGHGYDLDVIPSLRIG
ncbi:MAG: tRNA (adenosine(37)-N6)-threonylcarbamoyltransferase complex transferase subunit TsaD [Chloroflexi bacterium]|nr:tRNA (adenosine(37)-N6)-threonylcarbamoyltransferase complex transferase subunit TsaD [Chloroflexota bacterium]